MKKIRRYEIADIKSVDGRPCTVNLPEDAETTAYSIVGIADFRVVVYALIDPAAKLIPSTFYVYATNQDIPDERVFCATVVKDSFVAHVFQ